MSSSSASSGREDKDVRGTLSAKAHQQNIRLMAWKFTLPLRTDARWAARSSCESVRINNGTSAVASAVAVAITRSSCPRRYLARAPYSSLDTSNILLSTLHVRTFMRQHAHDIPAAPRGFPLPKTFIPSGVLSETLLGISVLDLGCTPVYHSSVPHRHTVNKQSVISAPTRGL